MGLSLQDFHKLPQKVSTEIYSTWLSRIFCKNVSSRPTDLFCRFCWNDSARAPFLATTTQLFLRVCLPTLFAAVLEIVLQLTTSAISGTANSNKSAPARFQMGRSFYAKIELQFSQYLVQLHRIPVQVVDQHLHRMESLLVLKQPPCNIF